MAKEGGDLATNGDPFVREMTPAGTPKGAFLLLHGMESHSGWFIDCAGRLVNDGWAVIAYDRTGWGKSSGPRGHLASYSHFVDQAVSLASAARAKYGPLHLAGMSWGGMAALYLGLRRAWLFNSISLLAPGIAAHRDISLPDKLRVASGFLRRRPDGLVAPLFEPRHFTRDQEWLHFIANDPDRVDEVTVSFCVETLKMRRFIREHAGARQLPPTLCLLAGDDCIIDNHAAAAVCRKAGAVVETVPDCAHTLVFERPGQTAAILSHHAENALRPVGSGTVWITGAGAIGGGVASLLSFGGVRTGVLVKPAYRERLERSGFTLQSGLATRTTGGGITFADGPEKLPGPPDLLLLAVKSFDTAAVLKELTGRIPPDCAIASLQNGVGNDEVIAAAFPGNPIIAASICASMELREPGHAVWADDRGGLGAALYRGNADIARTLWLSLMRRTGMECRWFSGSLAHTRLKWSKLMLNTAFNALNSITGLTSAAIMADKAHGDLALGALREGFVAMDRQGFHPVDLPGFPVSKLRLLTKMPTNLARKLLAWQAARSSEAAFSMRQDMVKKRQHTEIYEINGKIVDIGHKLGFPVPANEKLVEMVAESHKNNMT